MLGFRLTAMLTQRSVAAPRCAKVSWRPRHHPRRSHAAAHTRSRASSSPAPAPPPRVSRPPLPCWCSAQCARLPLELPPKAADLLALAVPRPSVRAPHRSPVPTPTLFRRSCPAPRRSRRATRCDGAASAASTPACARHEPRLPIPRISHLLPPLALAVVRRRSLAWPAASPHPRGP